MALETTIVNVPLKHVIGMKVRTTLDKAEANCPAIWQKFAARFNELSPLGDQSYGVSFAASEDTIDYWACVEVAPEAQLPEGMERTTIPAGLYASCTAPSIKNIASVYAWLYYEWERSQSEYLLDRDAPCFEAYRSDWQETSSLDILAPVKKR